MMGKAVIKLIRFCRYAWVLRSSVRSLDISFTLRKWECSKQEIYFPLHLLARDDARSPIARIAFVRVSALIGNDEEEW